ncbi:MAG: hypothetical protein ACOYK8_03020 [Alphaproteobacteria bacterium]
MWKLQPKISAKFCFLTLSLWMIAQASSVAQMDNRPYSFNNNGSGMSIGGREAIIYEKILGIHPDNLLRGTNGELLDVQKGPGGIAFATEKGTGVYLPQYRGTSWQGNIEGQGAGIFNGFFLPTILTISEDNSYGAGNFQASATVSTWTSRVISGGMAPAFMNNNVVDSWTGQVLMMDIHR